MGHRVNVVLDDETWQLIESIPKGERSRAVNVALAEWATRHRRRAAIAELDAVRARLEPVTTDEIVGWLREDRERDA